jgi:hypothetical protein
LSAAPPFAAGSAAGDSSEVQCGQRVAERLTSSVQKSHGRVVSSFLAITFAAPLITKKSTSAMMMKLMSWSMNAP